MNISIFIYPENFFFHIFLVGSCMMPHLTCAVTHGAGGSGGDVYCDTCYILKEISRKFYLWRAVVIYSYETQLMVVVVKCVLIKGKLLL